MDNYISFPVRSGLLRIKFANRGFTLVELFVTVAIGAILVSIAAPWMHEGIVNSKTKELSGGFIAALHLAQSEAIKRGTQVSIDPMQTTGNQWQTGWNIFADPNANGTQDAGEELIQTYHITSDGPTLASKDATFSSWLAFLPTGASRGNAGIGGGFRICRADHNLAKSRKITIQSSGNIIVETGTLTCPWIIYP